MPTAPATLPTADLLRALVVVLVWGLNFVVMAVALKGLNPMLLGALRFALASLPLLAFVARPSLPWQVVVGYGLLQGLGQFGLLFLALRLGMPAGLASVVMQMQAFFTLALAVPLLGERALARQWIGLVLAGAGLALIAAGRGHGAHAMTAIGLGLTTAAAFMWALSNLVLRLAARERADYDPFALIVWSSAVPVLPFVALAMGLDGAQATAAQLRSIGWREGFAVVYLAGLATLLAYTLWARLLRQHAATRIAPFTLLVPVVGLVAAALAFGERLAPVQWSGIAAVGLGLLVNQFGWPDRFRARHRVG